MELVHVDFTSVCPCNHHEGSMAKTVVKVLYERFIAVFGMPAKLLSDQGANFTSVLVEELCTMFGIQKCWTTAYHPQCNGQVEHFYQMLFRMISKLASDRKVQREQHLFELLQVYNSVRSAITGYSPHYLMSGRHPHLPVDFYFPMKDAHVHSRCISAYIEEVRKHFKEAYTEAQLQTNSKVEQQKQYYDKAISTMQLMPGDVILMKLDAFQGKGKVKDRWSKVEYVVTCQVTSDMPAYEVKDDGRNVKVTHHNRLFLVASARDTATPLGGSESVSYVSTAQSTLAELTPLESGGETSESEVEGVLTQHPASHVLLGWVDGVRWPLPSLALRLTICGLGSGDGANSLSNKDVH